jgi:hypothetical protein
MASGVAATDVFDLAVMRSVPMRVRRYQEEAARFRRMAEIETGDKLRQSLISLAEQYEELATNLAPSQHY